MIRLLRRVVRLGLLAAVGAGVLKVVRGRKASDPWAESWVSTGPPGGTRPSPAPVAAAAPKPPPPADMASATLAVPPPASAAPPAPATGDATLAVPPPAAPEPPAPAAVGRPAKTTRTGPARKSPTGKAEEPPGDRLWVAAKDGVCPQSHPIKAKLSSKIFHTPSGRNYSRTKADRCYPDEASAQADGLRPALR
jgi:hypothetical protein